MNFIIKMITTVFRIGLTTMGIMFVIGLAFGILICS